MDDLRDAIPRALVSESSASSKLRTRGVTPVQQARSKATFAALVTAGLKIAERNDFFASTVEDVVKAAKVSVGAFYERFESKETFFSVLQEIVARRIEIAVRKRVSIPGFAVLDFDLAVGAIVESWMTGVRLHRGLIRASLRHIPVRDDAWFPLRRLGAHMGDIFVEVLRERVAISSRRGLESRVRIALQFVHGVVVNIILNNPGPIGLDDRELDERIRQVLSLLVRDENGRKTRAPR